MKPIDALLLLDNVVKELSLSRQSHTNLQNALTLLAGTIDRNTALEKELAELKKKDEAQKASKKKEKTITTEVLNDQTEAKPEAKPEEVDNQNN